MQLKRISKCVKFKIPELKGNEMHKTFRFKLVPSAEQKILLNKHFGCVRFIYNHFLTEKQNHYQAGLGTLNYNKCSAILTQKKKEPEFVWLKEVSSECLVNTLQNLETAYSKFFT